ncbi:MAG: DUF2798 domain-containing protein [archaeon]
MRIPKKFAPLLFSTIMSFMMAIAMSFFMALAHTGFTRDFFAFWVSQLAIGFAVGFPAAFIVSILAKKIVDRVT